ncbi:MAG: hypothetical protein AB7K71_27990 [Polyangiaceae bacterium]
MFRMPALALLLLTLPMACGSSASSDGATISAGGASPDAGDAAAPEDAADREDAPPETTSHDFNIIDRCASDSEFNYHYERWTPEELPQNWDPAGFREMLQALSERRPGKYRIEATYHQSLDTDTTTAVLLVGDSGSVTYVSKGDWDHYHSGGGTGYSRAQQCELQPASFFEACLADDESLLGCADPSPQPGWFALAWLTACSPTEAMCQ